MRYENGGKELEYEHKDDNAGNVNEYEQGHEHEEENEGEGEDEYEEHFAYYESWDIFSVINVLSRIRERSTT